MAEFEPLTGRCLCGTVRFEVTSPPVSASYCHCTRCQRRTGGATSAQARLAPDSLRIIDGEAALGEYVPPEGFAKVFCTQCGSALFSHSPDRSVWSVRLGVIDGDPGIRPQWRQFVAYAAPWEPIPDDGLPRYDEGRP
jgi:hypothetical protein